MFVFFFTLYVGASFILIFDFLILDAINMRLVTGCQTQPTSNDDLMSLLFIFLQILLLEHKIEDGLAMQIIESLRTTIQV